jgi:transcriptional regulator with GAF, ATPase, and Fis domain
MSAVMERAVLIGQGRTLEVPSALGLGSRVPGPLPPVGAEPPPASRIEPLDVVIRRHIEAALAAAHGRVEGPHGAARQLQVNPHTLRARMRKLKIAWQAYRRPRGD